MEEINTKIYFRGQCINKNKFHVYKETASFYDIDIKKIVLSSKYSYDNKGDHKYYIGYMYDDHSSPLSLCLILPKMNTYFKHYSSCNTYTYFLTNNKMLKKYNKIWNRIKDLFGKEFNSELVYRD